MLLRSVKILLVLAVALWGIVGALLNVLHWDGTLASVTSATSMSTFEGGAEAWQATSNPMLMWLGAIFIAGSKFAAAALCLLGAGRMFAARAADAEAFTAAKELALAGCGIAVFMLFAGFIVVAESWFEMWRSEVLRAISLDSAFRYGGMIALIAIFVAQNETSSP